VSTTAIPGRFTTLPDEVALNATVVALQEHGFSVEVVGDLDTARQAVLAGRLLNRRASRICPQAPGGVP
jgi:hypothetical protein